MNKPETEVNKDKLTTLDLASGEIIELLVLSASKRKTTVISQQTVISRGNKLSIPDIFHV